MPLNLKLVTEYLTFGLLNLNHQGIRPNISLIYCTVWRLFVFSKYDFEIMAKYDRSAGA